jgi:hypothetical protein
MTTLLEPDQREGRKTIWLTATQGERPVEAARLRQISADVSVAGASLRVVTHDGIPAIAITGEKGPRNVALLAARVRMYVAGLTWVQTTADFAWLKRHLSEGAGDSGN